MARSRKIRVMISSRCNDRFPSGNPKAPTLSELRRKIKTEIESSLLFGTPAFEVWINEEAPPQGANWDSWEVCLEAVKDCDILLVLFNGNAGWAKHAGEIGICHDELATAYSLNPAKVRCVTLPRIACDASDEGIRNRRFQDYYDTLSPFRGGEVKTVDDLMDRVREALRDAVVTLMQTGVLAAGKGRGYSGQALDWNRLNFAERQKTMVAVLRDALLRRPGSSDEAGNVFVRLAERPVLAVLSAMPAAFSIAAAREMVGQPFLKDHLHAPALGDKRGGPVHFIACQKNTTEAHGIKLLGFPDATVVSTPFGVHVADNIQKIQLVLIANCADDPSTRHGVQRFFEWLDQTGEGQRLARRSAARARIVRQIAKEI